MILPCIIRSCPDIRRVVNLLYWGEKLLYCTFSVVIRNDPAALVRDPRLL